jgi:hypothetical protein
VVSEASVIDTGQIVCGIDVSALLWDKWRYLGAKGRARKGIGFECLECHQQVHPYIWSGAYGDRYQLFRHRPNSSCPSAGRESHDHMWLKAIAADAIRSQKAWDAFEEWQAPDGRRLDVMGLKQDKSDARDVEIQVSKVPIDNVVERTYDYAKSLPAANTLNAVCWITPDLRMLGTASDDPAARRFPWVVIDKDKKKNGQRPPMIVEGVYESPDAFRRREPTRMLLSTFIRRTMGQAVKFEERLDWLGDDEVGAWYPAGWGQYAVQPRRPRRQHSTSDLSSLNSVCPRVPIPTGAEVMRTCRYKYADGTICGEYVGNSEGVHMVMRHGAPRTWAKGSI